MVLLERDSALASLGEYARQASAGEGRLVLVSGEAGVGKSTVVEALADRLECAGEKRTEVTWSWGACDGLFTPRPLGPLFDVAETLGGELLDLCRTRASRDELFRAMLRQINRPGRLNVVVLEDLHWADDSTIDLVRYLGKRLRSVPVLLIATYRDDALTASDPLRQALGELATQRSTRRIGLAPLSREAVGVLAADSGLEPAELYRLTSGNPFYVTEVLHAGTGEVPPSARDATLARVAQLRPEVRRVLDIAALTSTRVELRVLRAAAGSTESTLDELVASGLLVGDGGWLRFRHEIARIAVEQAVAEHRRPGIHARILAALHSVGSNDDAGMAFHAEGAGDGPAVLEHAVRAARHAGELGSHREAAAQYERALRFADGLEASRLAELYDGVADEYSLFDRWNDAADANERAIALWHQAGDRLREGDTMRRYTSTLWRLCRGAESIDMIRRAVETLEPVGPSRELARASNVLGGQLWVEGDHEAGLAMMNRARDMAREVDYPMVLSEVLNTQAFIACVNGAEWKPAMLEALEIALAHNLEASAGRAYANMQANLVNDLQFAEAERFFVEGVTFCDDRSISTYGSCLRGGQAILLRMTGRWNQSVAICEDLLRRITSAMVNRMNPVTELGLIQARRGEEGAWSHLDEGGAAADGTEENEYMAPVHLARAEAFWLEGDLAGARREAEIAADATRDVHPNVVGAVAVWLRRLSSDHAVNGPIGARYEPHLAGDFEKAAELYLEVGCGYDAALALIDAGDEAALRRALDILHELGADATARIARQRMRDIGARAIPAGARAATRAHPLGLTRREHEVLDLICAGRTNAEIAAALVISAKTVDHHVSAVLAKLGAPSRGAAAAHAQRLGLMAASAG
jgi:DNA-binding CsgD family transcriptional regulator/tetratricopeptide (TPR) repeat protein